MHSIRLKKSPNAGAAAVQTFTVDVPKENKNWALIPIQPNTNYYITVQCNGTAASAVGMTLAYSTY